MLRHPKRNIQFSVVPATTVSMLHLTGTASNMTSNTRFIHKTATIIEWLNGIFKWNCIKLNLNWLTVQALLVDDDVRRYWQILNYLLPYSVQVTFSVFFPSFFLYTFFHRTCMQTGLLVGWYSELTQPQMIYQSSKQPSAYLPVIQLTNHQTMKASFC